MKFAKLCALLLVLFVGSLSSPARAVTVTLTEYGEGHSLIANVDGGLPYYFKVTLLGDGADLPASAIGLGGDLNPSDWHMETNDNPPFNSSACVVGVDWIGAGSTPDYFNGEILTVNRCNWSTVASGSYGGIYFAEFDGPGFSVVSIDVDRDAEGCGGGGGGSKPQLRDAGYAADWSAVKGLYK